jgi:Copper type II ascorbate-dependent monooxygenase, C-terminal domain
VRIGLSFLLFALGGYAPLACSSSGATGETDASRIDSLVLPFTVDAPANDEAYECFGFDASPLAERWLREITWAPPAPGQVELHHATLYAVPAAYPAGPVPCDSMPASWTMHVWAPGAAPLTLPSDVAIALPAGTRRLVVQTHALRFVAGPPARASMTLGLTDVAPQHTATWLQAVGSVPAIRPHMEEHTSTTCQAAAPMHVVTAWPHMHLIGKSFEGAIVRSDGTRSPIVDVPQWNFDQQRAYVVNVDVAAGQGVETDCTWFNPTDQYVLPGTSTNDEMCGQGLIVWPAQTAAWLGPCQ